MVYRVPKKSIGLVGNVAKSAVGDDDMSVMREAA
jgi:hypothetical protein